MDTNTRQLAHLVAQALEAFERAVLACLPPDKRAEVVLSAPWCEFRAVRDRLTGKADLAPKRLSISASEHGARGPEAGAILEALGALVALKFREHSTTVTLQGPVEIEEGRSGRIGCGNYAHLTIYSNGNHQWQGDATIIDWACEPLAHLGLGSKGAKG